MKRVPHSPAMLDSVKTVLGYLTDDEFDRDAYAYFPIEWNFTFVGEGGHVFEGNDGIGGPPTDDPDLLYIGMPLTEDEDDCVYWELRLSEVIEQMIDGGRSGNVILKENRDRYIAVRDNFLKLAAQIDAALARTE